MTRSSIAAQLTVSDVLRSARRAAPNHGYFSCPVHLDSHPSAHVVPNSGERAWRCFACGAKGGLLDLAVALGIGRDRASAARELERMMGR